ncbi:MAG: aspartate 1-decarboxylase [Candidatus Omnitrophica bacterium]|nr:aspartate 1-decarboxylase [Candidatus Omnitrophota bacterium]
MFIEICKSKIAHGYVTESELLYEGSITIDETLLKAVDILPGEKVDVLNINNGNRFTTYVIVGEAESGKICLNGPAARLGLVGDQIIVLSYAAMEPEEAKDYKAKIIYLDERNKIKN